MEFKKFPKVEKSKRGYAGYLGILKDFYEWREDTVEKLPFQLDVLAELLYDYVGNDVFSVTWFRELLQRWIDKNELLEALK